MDYLTIETPYQNVVIYKNLFVKGFAEAGDTVSHVGIFNPLL
jgi:hypothetical protein